MIRKRTWGLLLAGCLTLSAGSLLAASAGANTPSPSAPTLGAGPRVLRVADAAGPATAGNCGYTASVPADRFKGIPTFSAPLAARPFNVTLVTTVGNITFKALTTKAPCATNSFRFLASRGYFTHTHCHRLTTQKIFVLQCGDPTGTGNGGPGYVFNDENLAGATYPAGTVAMANAGPNTNGSQFFITTQDTKLQPDYTPFGTVVLGMDVLKKIAVAGEDDQNGPGDGFPNLNVTFGGVRITATG